MMEFSEKWSFKEGKEPIRLFNSQSGKRIHPIVPDAESREPIDPREISAGPGFSKNQTIRRIRFGENYVE